jgi:hypothetical protein
MPSMRKLSVFKIRRLWQRCRQEARDRSSRHDSKLISRRLPASCVGYHPNFFIMPTVGSIYLGPVCKNWSESPQPFLNLLLGAIWDSPYPNDNSFSVIRIFAKYHTSCGNDNASVLRVLNINITFVVFNFEFPFFVDFHHGQVVCTSS